MPLYEYLCSGCEHRFTITQSMKDSKKNLLLAHNSLETSTAALAMMEIIQNSESEFNAIMSMQIPKIVQFDNEEMEEKFYNMTKDVRASL